MKKIFLIAFTFISAVSLSGCFKISTPEMLLQAPELSSEKKSMKEAVESFRPQNTSSYPVYMKGDKTSSPMVIRDLDGDGSGEILSFYKKKEDDKIGAFILSKSDSLWIKKTDVEFDSYEINKVSIEDLNNNGKKEIIVESFDPNNMLNPKKYMIMYYNNGDIHVIKEVSYTVMQIYDINEDDKPAIYCVKNIGKPTGYVLEVSEFDNFDLNIVKTIKLENLKNPYNILVGNFSKNKKAVVIDYLLDEGQSNSRIFIYEKNDLVNLDDLDKFSSKQYLFNIPSEDINSDGIIEVGYKFKSPNINTPNTTDEDDLVNGYFQIKSDYSLEPISEKFESALGFTLSIPKSFSGRYTINQVPEETININFIDNSGKEYPLIKIQNMRKYDYIREKDSDKMLQLLIEGQEYVIVGSILDSNDNLTGEDRVNYIKMRSDSLILSNLVKENY